MLTFPLLSPITAHSPPIVPKEGVLTFSHRYALQFSIARFTLSSEHRVTIYPNDIKTHNSKAIAFFTSNAPYFFVFSARRIIMQATSPLVVSFSGESLLSPVPFIIPISTERVKSSLASMLIFS